MEGYEFDKLMAKLNGAYKSFSLEDNRLELWQEKLINLSYEISKKAIDNIIMRSKYAPTIADFFAEYEIAKNTLRKKILSENEAVACDICGGKGFIEFKVRQENGDLHDYFGRCRCAAGEKYRAWGMAPSYIYDELKLKKNDKEVYPGFVEYNEQEQIPWVLEK